MQMKKRRHEPPNVAGLSKQLYDEIQQLAEQKSLLDPVFEEAWNRYKRTFRKDPKNPGPLNRPMVRKQKKAGSASIVVIDRQGMYLTIIEKHTNGLPFGIPGGRLEPGESLSDAVAREFQEETNCYVHGKVVDIYLSKNKDMIVFVQVDDWGKDLVPCPPKEHTSSTVYMALLSLETMLDATKLGEELYFTIDVENKLVYRDPKKVKYLEDTRGKKLNIVQKTLFVSLDDLEAIRENGIRIRQAHRNDLNNEEVLKIFRDCLETNLGVPPSQDSEVSLE